MLRLCGQLPLVRLQRTRGAGRELYLRPFSFSIRWQAREARPAGHPRGGPESRRIRKLGVEEQRDSKLP